MRLKHVTHYICKRGGDGVTYHAKFLAVIRSKELECDWESLQGCSLAEGEAPICAGAIRNGDDDTFA